MSVVILYRDISVSVSYPELMLDYWSSRVQKKGVYCSCGPGCFTGLYSLTLRSSTEGILRRTLSDWNTVRAHAEWNNVQTDVVQAVEGDREGGVYREDGCQQSHFLSFDRLTYDQDEKWKENEVSVNESDIRARVHVCLVHTHCVCL